MSSSDLTRREPVPFSGAEHLHASGAPLGATVADFWRWACSDLMSNATRGVLAEFVVAQALEVETSCVRTEWDACDLRLQGGQRVEVKSAGYLQSWEQKAPSQIRFRIAPARGWDATTNTSSTVACRSADVYVFCLLAHQDKATVDPLDVAQWTFHVLPRCELDLKAPGQKTIGLSSLKWLGAEEIGFAGLKRAVERALLRG